MRRFTSIMTLLMTAVLVLPVGGYAAPVKHTNPDGSIPESWSLPKPKVRRHPDEAPRSAGGNGDGSNTLSFSAFESGDMIVTGGTLTGHAGEWDADYFRGSLSDSCIWSANVTPVNGVQREAPRKYRAYDYAWALWVPSLSTGKRAAARTYCRAQIGEPYVITSSKNNQSAWYCSKLCWASYRYTAATDLDGDGGAWVWPIDLVNDAQTRVFASAQ